MNRPPQADSPSAALDADRLVAWVRDAADELENAHRVLDDADVPRINPRSGNAFTLAARIHYRLDRGPLDPAIAREAWATPPREGP